MNDNQEELLRMMWLRQRSRVCTHCGRTRRLGGDTAGLYVCEACDTGALTGGVMWHGIGCICTPPPGWLIAPVEELAEAPWCDCGFGIPHLLSEHE